MAVATYTTNLTDLYAGAGSTTGWSALGGGASGLNAETDYFIQGTGMTSKNAFASTRKGMIYDSGSDRASLIGTDGAVLIWTTHATPNSLATIAAGGITALVGSSSSAYKHWYVGGSDTIEFMGWILAAVNPSETTDEADAGSPSAVEQFFGVLFDLPSGGPTKGAPNAIDAIRAGRCDLIYSLGTGADPEATFDAAVTATGDVTNRYGLIQERSGSFFLSGLHQFGDTGVNVVEFTDSNKTLFWNDHPAVTAPFNTVEIQHASSIVSLSSISWKALGTKSPGTWVTTDNATVTLTGCSFIDWGEFAFASNTTASSTFQNCGAIDAQGADLSGSSILTPNVVANNSGLVWDIATDPDGLLDNMTFTKTAATAHHAIEFGTTIPSAANYTLRGCDFGTAFSATEDGTVGDETFHFLDTTGTITLNLVACTGNFGYRSEGVAVTIVADPVTTSITVTDTASPPVAIENARVFFETADGTGPFPYQEAVTIVQTAGTATVTHTAHGMVTNNYVVIRGATQNGYNKVAQITVTGVNTYTYAVDSGTVSPATGSPVASAVIISGLTNASGIITDSRTFSSDQPIKGWARKSSGSPYYQQGAAAATISNTAGVSITLPLASDE